MLTANTKDTFIENFNQLEDPRIEIKKLYPLIEIVFLVVCAKICGAESFREYARFGQAKITLLQERLPFANGIPSKATRKCNALRLFIVFMRRLVQQFSRYSPTLLY